MSNISKTMRFLKRNGLKNTYYAVKERLDARGVPYSFTEITEAEEARQRDITSKTAPVLFSILVPVYETNEKFLREMIESCLNQTYPNFELILADASDTTNPKSVIDSYEDSRIKYIKVIENKGIAENTNVAVEAARGDYCVLLDHDDLLTKDALYRNASAILKAKKQGITLKLIYSDEDKCDGEAKAFFEPHYKEKLNLDLLLSNNYICHLAVLETSLIKELKFRGKYNGSQDHDLFLRAVGKIMFKESERIPGAEREIAHISKVLYHWRCHEASTAFNPASKEYAYKAGKAAVKDFVKNYYGDYPVKESLHKGFYNVDWGKDIFASRKDVGAYGGLYTGFDKITTGIYNSDGTEDFKGMNKHYSGYMHKAHLIQEAYALDIRTIVPSSLMLDDYNELVSLSDNATDEEIKTISIEFAERVRAKGLILLYVPKMLKA